MAADPGFTDPAYTVRTRDADDLDAVVEVAGDVHRLDGYPPYLPDGDLLGFLTSEETLGAWVATTTDRAVVGHVALNRWSSFEVLSVAEAMLDLSAEELGVVARLLVAPSDRRAGVAARLLDTAAQACWSMGRWPILDVVDRFTPAIALYERAGWSLLGTVEVTMPDGVKIRERVYAAPPEPGRSI